MPTGPLPRETGLGVLQTPFDRDAWRAICKTVLAHPSPSRLARRLALDLLQDGSQLRDRFRTYRELCGDLARACEQAASWSERQELAWRPGLDNPVLLKRPTQSDTPGRLDDLAVEIRYLSDRLHDDARTLDELLQAEGPTLP